MRRPPADPTECWQHVVSTETWNGGDGTISFNYLQQREVDTSETPEEPESTDIWGISD